MRKLESVVLTVALLSRGLSAQTLTITNATLVDVSTGTLRRGTTVVIDGNRIVSVGPSAPASASKGQSVDAKGMYLIPTLGHARACLLRLSTAAIANEFILPSFSSTE
jgi:adenine deaminase